MGMLPHFNASQTKILKKAGILLAEEQEQKNTDREQTLSERAPPLKLPGLSVQDLQVAILWSFVRVFWQCSFLHAGALLTESVQRPSSKNWCCWWGTIWHSSKSFQTWNGGTFCCFKTALKMPKRKSINWCIRLLAIIYAFGIDSRFKPQNLWAEGQNEETCPEESEGVCWSHAGGSARFQTQGIHRL